MRKFRQKFPTDFNMFILPDQLKIPLYFARSAENSFFLPDQLKIPLYFARSAENSFVFCKYFLVVLKELCHEKFDTFFWYKNL